jgi:hypothetical protein
MKERDLEKIEPAVDFVKKHPGLTDEFYPILTDILCLGYRLGKNDKHGIRLREVQEYLKNKIDDGH